MKYRNGSLLALVILALMGTGCTLTPKRPIKVIRLDRQILVFKPTRDDMTVGEVSFSIFSSNLETVGADGKQGRFLTSTDFRSAAKNQKLETVQVNGLQKNTPFTYLDLRQVAKNQFELPPLEIKFPINEPDAVLCLSIQTFLKGVDWQQDAKYYVNLNDRHTLISYCTSWPYSLPVGVDRDRVAPFNQNRVATLKEFKKVLSKPFVIKLNKYPI